MPPRSRLPLKLLALGVVVLMASGIVVGLTINPLSHSQSPAPTGANAHRIDQHAVAIAYVDVPGGIRSLSPTMPGRVRALPVPEGKEVPSGTVLLQLDDDQARNDLAQAKLALEDAKEKLVAAHMLEGKQKHEIEGHEAAVEAALAKERIAQLQSDKADRFFKSGVKGADEDIKAAKDLVKEAAASVRAERAKLAGVKDMSPKSAIKMAEVNVESKKRLIEKAQLAVNECQIKAPCRGMILRQLVNVGELLGPMSKGPALQFCPAGNRIIRAEVEQDYAARVRVGQKAIVQDEITGAGEWTGKVIGVSDWYTQRRDIRIEPMQFNDVRTLEVIIRLDDAGTSPLRINQRVRVKLDGAE